MINSYTPSPVIAIQIKLIRIKDELKGLLK